jgi:hypothetical protein
MAGSRMDDHILGFIDNKQRVVLIENVQGYIFGKDINSFRFREGYVKAVAGPDPCSGFHRLSIQQGHFLRYQLLKI